MHTNQIINFIVGLIAITNPFGNMAIFLGLTSKKTLPEKRHLALVATLAIVIILLTSTWLGDGILKSFGISLSAFELAGALVITLVGLSLLSAHKSEFSHTDEEATEAKTKESIAVVPLAIPIIAGPGAITTLIIYAHKFPGVVDKLTQSLIDIGVAIFIGLILYFSDKISRVLGIAGVKILTRVMGLILIAMAMQMLISGLMPVLHPA